MTGAVVQRIAVSGHRSLARPGGAGPGRVRRTVRALIARYPQALWIAGGAVGADQIAADEVLAAGARLALLLPFPVAVQAARWSATQRQVLENQAARAEAVCVVRFTYDVRGYHDRNQLLVRSADLLVAFWDGRPSGTGSTVHEARRRGTPVHWVPV